MSHAYPAPRRHTVSLSQQLRAQTENASPSRWMQKVSLSQSALVRQPMRAQVPPGHGTQPRCPPQSAKVVQAAPFAPLLVRPQ
jgi:hypothetical protein